MINFRDKEALNAVADFIISIPLSVTVDFGQENRVPASKGEFCVLNFTGRVFHSQNRSSYTDDLEADIHQKHLARSTEIILSVDFYGADAGENAQQFCAAFNDDYAYSSFPENIKPLKSTNPSQIALQPPERQYVERWRLECSVQVAQVVSVNQDFFDKPGDTTLINVPETF